MKQKIVQADGGCAEGIGLDDVRAGFEILAVNFLDHLRLGQVQELEAAFEIFAFPIAETLAAIIRLGQFVAAGSSCPWRHRERRCARASTLPEDGPRLSP